MQCSMFTDDTVVHNEEKEKWQTMVTNHFDYCKLWKSEVNLQKSKVMVFRNGGRPVRDELWLWTDQATEVVTQYKYLGVTLTPTLSLYSSTRKLNQHYTVCTECGIGF